MKDHVHRCAECGRALPRLGAEHPAYEAALRFLAEYGGKSRLILAARALPPDALSYDLIEQIASRSKHFREWNSAKGSDTTTQMSPTAGPSQPHPLSGDVTDFVRGYGGKNAFLVSLRQYLRSHRSGLTQAQIVAATKSNEFWRWRSRRAAARAKESRPRLPEVDTYAGNRF